LATLKPEHQTIGKQEFRLFDHNHNSQLEYKEYLNTPAIPLAQRNLPDPITERVAEHLSALRQKWNDWDQDQDRQLNQKEFMTS
ncbi:hypothetical protein, partial [Enterococcus avium]|uniref:hypothetical protein n=1 Tax=Enterococcus avium TaxID=33945 RepID=UPI003D0FC479